MPIVILSLVVVTTSQERKAIENGRSSETSSIDGLHFCALILNEFYDKSQSERIVDVIMPASDVNEDNLHLLFKNLSGRFPNDPILKVWVRTDVTQLGTLATGRGGSGAPEGRRVLQLGYYKRTSTLELFSYNPTYPMPGEKTVIIRGKED